MYRPWRPTYFEMADYLKYFLSGDAHHKWDDISATEHAEKDAVAVFHNYYSPYPAYHGNIMVRLSGLRPYEVGVYVWSEGKIMPASDYLAKQGSR